MTSNFNTFIPKSDQKLAENHFKNYPGRYTETTKWMFRFVCWLKNLNDVHSLDKFQTIIKTGTKALAIFGMVILCPLVIGGFLLNWYIKANRNVDYILTGLRKSENEELEKIIMALGIEKQGIDIPNIQNRPSNEKMEVAFEECKSPIFQCNGDFIALLIQDKKTKEKRVATIEKTNRDWEFKGLKSPRASVCTIFSGVSSEYYRALEFNLGIDNLKTILKGKSAYDELVSGLIRKPQEEPSLGGLSITEGLSIQGTVEHAERQKIMGALGGKAMVKKVPALQKRPLSRNRMAVFEQLRNPIFQSGGNFISILIQDKKTGERKIITVKKGEDTWHFRKFPVDQATSGGCRHGSAHSYTKIKWLLDDGFIKSRIFQGQTRATQCETHIEFLQEVVGVSTNKYKLADF